MNLRRTLLSGIAVAAAVSLSAALAGSAGAATATPATATASKHLPSWTLVSPPTASHFRGLAAVSRSVAWISGYTGIIERTVDGGRTWTDVSPAGASTLQFRDISAFDATHAVAMAAGSGTDSVLYSTSNGGRSWQIGYQNTNPAAFFDCMSFSDAKHGLVLSDPVDGKFRILSTSNGGRSWAVLPTAGMPAALTGEAGYAASGECLTTSGHDAWFGGGGGTAARIFHSRDGGLHWTVVNTKIPSSASAGVIGLAFKTPLLGIAVGGDFNAPAATADVAATSFLNSPWFPAKTQPTGYRSGIAWVPFTLVTAVSVGLTGSDISYDAGRNWTTFDTGQFDTVSCAHDGACWASGDLGRVAVLNR